jgi:putative salt-induced outer membrane protein
LLASRIMLTAGLLLCTITAHAQQTAAPDPISGKAALGYLATSGNTESTNANASFELSFDPASPWRYDFRMGAVGASTNQQTTAEAYSFAHKAQRDFSETDYLFAAADWSKDRFSGYRKQLSETVGYGRRLLHSERQLLSLEAGIGAKQATLIDGQDQDEGIVRGALDYAYTLSETTQFTQRLLFEIGDKNTYSESVSKLSARLIGNISLVVSYTLKNNSDVPAGSENRDTFTAIALEYGF